MVFYRKYRPQTLLELDSTLVRETLTKVLTKSVPHAMLFTGPKGLGKTSTARIVAKVVNCTERAINYELGTGNKKQEKKVQSSKFPVQSAGGIEPCNTCTQCLSITNGTNMDVMEIDAASNRGIDEMRELKDKIRLAPLSASKKVYIIDEVHMLTTEAFNALLKTLEEPPVHAMFMLCTTEPQKVPATILSRCFHVSFKPATKEELVRSFKRIALGEKMTIDDDALFAIANLSEGGFRDGAKMLEEIGALSDREHITKAEVEKHFQVAGVDHLLSQLVGLMANHETTLSLTLVSQFVAEGINVQYFTEQLLSTFHTLLLAKAGINTNAELQITSYEFSLDELQQVLSLLTRAHGEMRVAVIQQLPLEIALIAWCSASAEPGTVQNLAEQNSEPHAVEVLEETVVAKKVMNKKDETVSVTSLRREVGNIAKIKALYGEKHLAVQASEKPSIKTSSVELLNYTAEGDITPEWMDTFWQCIISEMKQHNHTVAGVLRGCVLKSFDRKSLIIETPFKFHKDKLEDGKNSDALVAICKELIGKPISIAIVLKAN